MKKSSLLLSIITAFFLVFSIVVPSFAASSATKPIASVKVLKKVTSTKNIDVHKGPGTNYGKMGTAKKGKVLEVVGTSKSSTWYKIKWSNAYGYVYAKYTKNGSSVASKPKLESSFILATTTSTQDSGLLDVIIPVFEAKYDVDVKVVAVGTGQAIKMGEQGDADVLLVHDRKSEDKFVKDGHGEMAYNLMYNQFLLVGPKNDPAKIENSKTIAEALGKIDKTKSIFISRGDDSGTNKKEISLWKNVNINPDGQSWYKKAGQGMGDTLRMADELGGYTLSDEATFLTNKTSLGKLMSGQTELLNPYGIMRVKGTKKPNSSKAFIDYLVSSEGQKLIGKFGKTKYGKPLFVPNASKRK